MTTTQVFPKSLVMRQSVCEYCGVASEMQTAPFYLFGIMHCEDHADQALRDCRRYLAHQGIISFSEYYGSSCAMNKLLNDLKETTFRVARSNGMIDDGWSLYYCDFDTSKSRFMYCPNVGWCMGVKKEMEEKELAKVTSIVSTIALLEEDGRHELAQRLREAIAVLDTTLQEFKKN